MITPSETPCPDAASLAALADGALDEPARTAIAEHVAGCEECLDAVEMLVRMASRPVPNLPADLKAAALAIVARPRSIRRWQPLAAAAAIVLSVGGWYVVQQRGTLPPASTVRSDDRVRSAPSESQAPHVVRPAAGERVRRSAIAIEWRHTQAAIAYRVRIMRDDGQLLWEHETQATTAVIPEATPLPSGVPLYVAATAVMPDGKTTRAPAVMFEITGCSAGLQPCPD